MIVVTGAAGFIGSCIVSDLNGQGKTNLALVDDFTVKEKEENYRDKKFLEKIDREKFIAWAGKHKEQIEFVLHIGARTDTTEFDMNLLNRLNLDYSKEVWKFCAENKIPLIYASSAATYGLGEHGYTDDESNLSLLKPLNPYGISKNEFDKWAIKQELTPPHWYGLKFFNVYGPNEYHKGRMASVIFHAFKQVREMGVVKLFRSHRPDYMDGEQLRDFIYVKDVLKVIRFLMDKRPESGIYNLGTGEARTFLDLARATFGAMATEPKIEFIDTPSDIRDKYQYFTEADMTKLVNAGFSERFTTLEAGVGDYVRSYLAAGKYF